MISIKITYEGYHGHERQVVKDFQDKHHMSNYIRIMQNKGCKIIKTEYDYGN